MALAIIQARMSSSRLPGKVLLRVEGKSLLEWQASRLKRASAISRVVVATTVNPADNDIEKECKKLGLTCYRGQEDDVLDRFFVAAKAEEAREIFRFTADCPLIDADVVDKVYSVFAAGECDYVHTGSTYSEGVDTELLSFEALERCWRSASTRAQREHLTLYINQNQDLFRCCTVENDTDDAKYRFTVDEPQDFEVVKAIIEGIHAGTPDFRTREIKEFLDNRPALFSLNAQIKRNEGLTKSLRDDEIDCQ